MVYGISKIKQKLLLRTSSPLLIKLGGILLILLFLKLFMIGTGFFAAKHLKGDAATINFAGSERMRSFKIGLLLESWLYHIEYSIREKADTTLNAARDEIIIFEKILYGLRDGNSELGIPGVTKKDALQQLNRVIGYWESKMKPLLEDVMIAPRIETSRLFLYQYKIEVHNFVNEVDRFVLLHEQYSTWKVKVFNFFQYIFLILTVGVTVLAILLIMRFIKKPLKEIQSAILRVTSGDFKVRVKPLAEDEIGSIATGFNYMVEKLEGLYKCLEDKVTKKEMRLAAMEERVLIANELHDSIAQSLAFLKIQGQLLNQSFAAGNISQANIDLASISRGIEECNRDVRELLTHFRTRIDPDGLEKTIEKYLVRFNEETGINITFNVSPDIPAIPAEAEIHVLRIIQEALSNVRKYAVASAVKVYISKNGCFEVEVTDNGKGFDVSLPKNRGFSHMGIDIMRERAHRLNGELIIESQTGAGTRVLLRIPDGEEMCEENNGPAD
ncbi:MAG: HAMP domain-containing protein [Nitrospirae bacterium]|nr:HAMP domain-containing protein [Nitrospirota bacterium]